MPDLFHLILSPEAAEDLEDIHAFISKDSEQNAAKTVERILVAIESLAVFPGRNLVERASDKIPHPVRSLPVKPFIIYFRVLDEQRAVRILSVRHGARKRPGRLP